MEDLLESIADAVSALVMYSIEAEENNTAIPDIVPGAQGVKAATDYLCNLAEQSAQNWNTVQRPDMTEKMVGSCNDIRGDTQGIVDAATILRDSPFDFSGKKKLMMHAKDIMEHMVLLLQLADLYDVTRIVKIASACIDQLREIVNTSGESFKNLAQSMVSSSGDVIRGVTKRLPKIDDFQLKQELNKYNEALKNDTNPVLQAIATSQPAGQAQGTCINDLEEIIRLVKLSAKSPFDLGALSGLDMRQHEDIVDINRSVADNYDQLINAIKAGNAAAANKAFEQIKKGINDELQIAKALAGKMTDPEMKRKLEDAIANAERALDGLFGKMQDAINNAIANPTNENLKKLDDIFNQIKAITGDLASGTAPPNADDLYKKSEELEDLYDDLIQAAKAGNSAGVQAALDGIRQGLHDQVDMAREAAKHMKDPEMRRRLEEAIANADRVIDGLVDRMGQAAQDVINNPGNKDALNKLENIINEARGISGDLVNAANDRPDNIKQIQDRLNNNYEQLKAAAARGDRRGVEDALADIRKGLDDELALARQVARNCSDPILRQQLEDAINQAEKNMDKKFGDVSNAAREAVNEPNNKGLQDKLARAVDALKDESDKLANDVGIVNARNNLNREADDLLNAVKAGNSANANNALRDIGGDVVKAADAANNIANKLPAQSEDPRKERLQEKAAEIKTFPPTLQSLSKNAIQNPNDGNAKAAIEKGVKDFKKKADQIASAALMPTEDELMKKALAIDEKLRDIESIAKHGDMNEINEKLKDVLNDMADQVKISARLAAKSRDPRKRDNLLKCGQDLSNIIKALVDCLKACLLDPNDPNAREKLAKMLADARTANLALVGKEKQLSQRELDEIRRKEEEEKRRKEEERRRNAAERRRLEQERRRQEEEMRRQQENESAAQALRNRIAQAHAQRQANTSEARKKMSDAMQKIAEQMERLEEAVRSGAKSAIIEASRAIATLSQEVVQAANEEAANVKDPVLKEQIMVEARAAKNTAVQLKIMASVKCATSDDDPTLKTQLVHCAKAVAKSLIGSIDAAEKAANA